MSTEVSKFADPAMYRAVPATAEGEQVAGPRVTLIQMTPDPLGSIAAACRMYEGKQCHSIDEITEAERDHYFTMLQNTHLKAGLEFVDFHFMIENVTRAFTHQMVRQRTAVYVQESQRFAVKDNSAWEVALPPSLAGLKDDDPRLVLWRNAILDGAATYNSLINAGVPAEDARGLLPTNITTRIHYKTNLRSLQEQAGNRLCTQAQFEWRIVWAQIVKSIREASFGPDHGFGVAPGTPDEATGRDMRYSHSDGLCNGGVWRGNDLADLFKPVCFLTGRCEFRSNIDRYCSIRDRVDAHAKAGDAPATWVDIEPREWLADPTSARKKADR